MMQGLRQRILTAPSEAEVTKLLAEGKTYEFANRRTKNSWKSAAHRRLTGKALAPVEIVEEEEEVVVKKPWKKNK